jgi:hypothetical protein
MHSNCTDLDSMDDTESFKTSEKQGDIWLDRSITAKFEAFYIIQWQWDNKNFKTKFQKFVNILATPDACIQMDCWRF